MQYRDASKRKPGYEPVITIEDEEEEEEGEEQQTQNVHCNVRQRKTAVSNGDGL